MWLILSWVIHTLAPASTSWKGADGVEVVDIDQDGTLDVATPWEQSGKVSLVLGSGTTVSIGSGLGAIEDAKAGDINGDGCLDLVIASESKRVIVAYQSCSSGTPAPNLSWVMEDLPGVGGSRWLQVALADFDEDGTLDVVVGGKISSASTGGILLLSRVNGSWTTTSIAGAGWVMSLLARDMDGDGDLDLLSSDRKGAGNLSSKKGSWWYEQTGGTWSSHHIAQIPGEAGFLSVFDATTVVDGNRTTTWMRPLIGVASVIPFPLDVGDYHSSTVADVDNDGTTDLIMTYALTTASGVVWLKGPTWSRQEVSGAIGHKYDNAVAVDMDNDGDLDIVTSEGGDTADTLTDDLGVIWFENPTL